MSSSSNLPPHSFPHHTSSAAPRMPFIDTSTQAINATPVELDSTPVSPVAKQLSWSRNNMSEAKSSGAERGRRKSGERSDDGLSKNRNVTEDLSGKDSLGQEERQKREALLKERSQDPAVVVNVPEEPGAEELAVTEEEVTSQARDQAN